MRVDVHDSQYAREMSGGADRGDDAAWTMMRVEADSMRELLEVEVGHSPPRAKPGAPSPTAPSHERPSTEGSASARAQLVSTTLELAFLEGVAASSA